MDRTRETESWGGMVRSIDAERKALPWGASDFSKSTTMSLAEVRLCYFQSSSEHAVGSECQMMLTSASRGGQLSLNTDLRP
jgi:hypothetical protein